MSTGDLKARRKNWTGGNMDAKGVDEELRSIRRAIGSSLNSLGAASIITAVSESGITGDRVLTGTSNQVSVTDNGAGSTIVLSLPSTINTPGVLNIPNTDLKIGGNQLFPILQVIIASTSTSFTTTSSTFVTSNLSGSITPKFTTSKILVWVSGDFAQQTGTSVGYATIARGSTNLAGAGGFTLTVAGNNYSATMIAYDSPATTSATTYNVQLRTNGGGTAIFPITDGGANTSTATMILVEIAQ